jgi:hypothetical protein
MHMHLSRVLLIRELEFPNLRGMQEIQFPHVKNYKLKGRNTNGKIENNSKNI